MVLDHERLEVHHLVPDRLVPANRNQALLPAPSGTGTGTESRALAYSGGLDDLHSHDRPAATRVEQPASRHTAQLLHRNWIAQRLAYPPASAGDVMDHAGQDCLRAVHCGHAIG